MIKAKIFKNGQSQAVRLPKCFRLEGSEVSVTRLGTGIILQPIISSWKDVFSKMNKIVSDELLTDREDMPLIDKESLS
jgi:antitoxin VapB